MVSINKLGIKGAWLIKSPIHFDNRGQFREWYKSSSSGADEFGTRFNVMQANISVSKKGATRGIHYSLSKVGQAKMITCLAGSAFDVIVDIRIDSPTFGSWISVNLKPEDGNTVYLSSGLGHGVMSLENNTVVSYLLSSEYSPQDEYSVNLFDETLDIRWPLRAKHVSKKDSESFSLKETLERKLLPLYNS